MADEGPFKESYGRSINKGTQCGTLAVLRRLLHECT